VVLNRHQALAKLFFRPPSVYEVLIATGLESFVEQGSNLIWYSILPRCSKITRFGKADFKQLTQRFCTEDQESVAGTGLGLLVKTLPRKVTDIDQCSAI
jgi:hypothetical protein